MDCPRVQRNGYVVIVDPYSSSMYVVQELRLQQIPMIGIQSTQNLAEFWLNQYDASLFEHTIKHETLENTLSELAKFDVIAVIPGSEPGVVLAEDLQCALGVIGNDSETSHWRRHKYHMQQRLCELNIRAVKQTFVATVEECLEWQAHFNTWPIIVKPAMSGGTDGVYWCHNKEDCDVAFRNECGKLNCNGEINDKLLCQEFLDGIEYVVDCISYQGKHVLSCLWAYKKMRMMDSNCIIYEWSNVIESRGEIQNKIVDYVLQVLDALDIKNGPSHSEVIVVDGEPCLVETGARMHGLKGPKMIEFATGLGLHELVVDVFVHGGRIFNSLYKSNYRYILKKHALVTFFLNTQEEGILAEDISLERILKLRSVLDARVTYSKGQYLPLTRDIATCYGYSTHVHQSWKQILADVEFVRHTEADREFIKLVPNSPRSSMRGEVNTMCSSPRKGPSPLPQFSYCDAVEDEDCMFELVTDEF